MPFPLKDLSSLTKAKFSRCEFPSNDWLSEAHEDAAQVEARTLEGPVTVLPGSVCSMTGLMQLYMRCNGLRKLPAEFACLTSLENVHLIETRVAAVSEV